VIHTNKLDDTRVCRPGLIVVKPDIDAGLNKVSSKLQKCFVRRPWGDEIIPGELVSRKEGVDMTRFIEDADVKGGRSRLEAVKGIYAF
jgi:hypothetical protein